MKHNLTWILIIAMLLMPMAGWCEAIYDDEILFRSLPWLMDVESYTGALGEELQIEGNAWTVEPVLDATMAIWPTLHPVSNEDYIQDETTEIQTEDGELPTAMEYMMAGIKAYIGYDAGVHFYSGELDGGTTVAGYPLKAVAGDAVWALEDGQRVREPKRAKVVRARYILDFGGKEADEIWEDLKAKLTQVYGENVKADEITPELDDMQSLIMAGSNPRRMIWYGENNTYAMLYFGMGKDEIKQIMDMAEQVGDYKPLCATYGPYGQIIPGVGELYEPCIIEYGRADLEDLLREIRLADDLSIKANEELNTDGL